MSSDDFIKTVTVLPMLGEITYKCAYEPIWDRFAYALAQRCVEENTSLGGLFWNTIVNSASERKARDRSEINTTLISNDTLKRSFNELWKDADFDGNGTLDFGEFRSAAKRNAGVAAKAFVTEARCRKAYENIGGGEPITRAQLVETMMSEYGIDLEQDPNVRSGLVIKWHNNDADK